MLQRCRYVLVPQVFAVSVNGTYDWNRSAAWAPTLSDGTPALFVGFHDQILAPVEIRKHDCPARACTREPGIRCALV